jgi:hypothetical protein
MIPIWFPIVTAIKLVEFIITSKLLKAKYPTNGFDKTGKAAIGIVMLMPGLFIFRHIITNYITVMSLTVYLVTALFALSSFGRIACLARPIKAESSK